MLLEIGATLGSVTSLGVVGLGDGMKGGCLLLTLLLGFDGPTKCSVSFVSTIIIVGRSVALGIVVVIVVTVPVLHLFFIRPPVGTHLCWGESILLLDATANGIAIR